MKIKVIHGPNLNLLGTREPDIYGRQTLDELNTDLLDYGKKNGMSLDISQSNSESDIVDLIQKAGQSSDALLINAAAYTHTSVAIRDAISALSIPCIEVHLSNIYKRESFRHHSMLADVCNGQITGFGPLSYRMALYYLANRESAA